MAKQKSELEELFDKYRYDEKNMAKKSRVWFEQQALLLSKKRITPNQLLNKADNQLTTNVIPGRMYMFAYDPKTKATLPYYDKFPLVFPFAKTNDGFIGLNMHYLPHKLRFLLLERLMAFKTNNKMDETTRIRYSWQMIDGVSKFALAKPCVKHYLRSHLRSAMIDVNSSDWSTAMMLPVERFVGATTQQVWIDSRRKAV
jgi:hypothetical protein